ncbi:hypothetical protein PS15m_004673 [Mucor circinelloides]
MTLRSPLLILSQSTFTQAKWINIVFSKSISLPRSLGPSRAADCVCSDEAVTARIIIPLITEIGIILALNLRNQRPFSQSPKDQREAKYYDGADTAVIDTTRQLDITMNSTVNGNSTAIRNDTAADTFDDLYKRNVFITKIIKLHELD